MKKTGLILLMLGLNAMAQDHDEHGGYDHAAQGQKDAHEESAELEVVIAEGGLVQRMASFPAEIIVNRDRAAAVSPKYAGTVREVYVEIGDTVKKGDLLATMESRDTLANYPVKAPLAGTVVARTKSAGEVAGEDAALFEIVDLSSVWVEIHVFPQYRHAVTKGQQVHLIASDGDEVEAVVDYVSPLVDPGTRTLKARCVLTGAGDEFSPGTFVRAQIAVESVQARVRIEKESVQTMNGETIVFVVDEHGPEPRDVQVGISDQAFAEIQSGLEPGEKVVARGAFHLKAELVTSGLDPHAGHGH
jgi:cobalt-zinc-cadmium efflux system membrane fusion protein